MARVAFRLQVKKERIDAYVEEHRQVWPEMLEALREAGWHNYSLFLDDDGSLFGYLETPGTFEQAKAAMARTEVNRLWQERMAPYFEAAPGQHADRVMVRLKEVFHLD